MSLEVGQVVLRRNYALRRRIAVNSAFELWEADRGGGEGILIKAWPFINDEPSLVERNLWDRELRTLYRLASTPDAERHLVTLIDAAVDRDADAFILALKVPGFDRLSDVLAKRRNYSWLSDVHEPSKRILLWRAALGLIEGLSHIHRFRSVHTRVTPDNVFLDASLGPTSLRLGGFEWSVRLGELGRDLLATSATGRANASLNADWRAMGVVLARIFGANDDAFTDAARTRRAIGDLPRITDDEKSFLLSLIEAVGSGALDGDDIAQACRSIMESLDDRASLRPADRFGVVTSLRDAVGPTALAVRVAQTDSEVSATDEEAVRRWIEDDLADSEIVVVGSVQNPLYFLKGRRLPYRLVPFEHQVTGDATSESTWNLGYLVRADFLDERNGAIRPFPMPRMIRAYTLKMARTNYADLCRRTRSWAGILPALPEATDNPHPQLTFLRRFLEVTNEIERTIRKTEVFPVRLVRQWSDKNHEYIIVEECPSDVESIILTSRRLSMVDHLTDEDQKAQREELEVYIGAESELAIQRWVAPTEYWTLHDLPAGESNTLDSNQVLLRRFTHQEQATSAPDKSGFLRTRGMFAQVELLDRRAEAIDLFVGHLFLQRALVLPDTVYMDTGVDDLPVALPPQEEFDDAKRDALQAIWRTRPIYCLQGPPGTGKTTLVAQVLRQIYEDDPSCQILLTAQAHSAVDHLRDEVDKFVNARRVEDPNWTQPIAIRLRKVKPSDDPLQYNDPALLPEVARRILEEMVVALDERVDPPDYVQEWLTQARQEGPDGDFVQLVRRSANFVYCTSTAADLSELAHSHQTFDWSIIEEAGKAHGFDLVLPLQTGHRWLLIGDQNQLPPYREKDFAAGLDRLGEICSGAPELRRFWESISVEDRQQFTSDAKRWLLFFRELFTTIARRVTSDIPLVGMLTEQHRMHPDIGDMISHAFYDGKIRNGTIDPVTAMPLPRVAHDIVEPVSFVGRAIVWINVSRSFERAGRGDGREVNESEVAAIERLLRALDTGGAAETLALLTPYRLQLRELRARLRDKPSWATLPEGFELLNQGRPGIFTVDSFQGRQASVVIVSLVRSNSERDTGRALGFLREHERMNVMMSRAEKLLVLVGSWPFFRDHLAGQSREDGQPFAELARLTDWLEKAFSDGTALLMDARDIPSGHLE